MKLAGNGCLAESAEGWLGVLIEAGKKLCKQIRAGRMMGVGLVVGNTILRLARLRRSGRKKSD
jgi:hypothetical protein